MSEPLIETALLVSPGLCAFLRRSGRRTEKMNITGTSSVTRERKPVGSPVGWRTA